MLRGHCEAVGRNYDDIQKTIYYVYDTSQGIQKIVDDLGGYAEMGFSLAIGQVKGSTRSRSAGADRS